MTTSNDRLDRIEALVERNSEAIDKLTADISQLSEDVKRWDNRLSEEIKRWDDRFFQFSRDNLTIARTIIITAGTVVILSPVLQALAPAIETVVSRFLGVGQS